MKLLILGTYFFVLFLSVFLIGENNSIYIILFSSILSLFFALIASVKIHNYDNLYFLLIPFKIPKIGQNIITLAFYILSSLVLILASYFTLNGLLEYPPIIDLIILSSILILLNFLTGATLVLAACLINFNVSDRNKG